MWQRLLDALPGAARSPSAVLLYICLLVAYLIFVSQTYRLKRISKSIALVPEKQRAAILEKEYLTFPKSGLSANQWLQSRRQLFYLLAFVATLIAGLVFALITYQAAGEKAIAKPPDEVALRFVYPQAPALIVVNPSDAVIRNAKWYVGLWNLNLADRNDPLPIPVSTFDWIKPHDEGGPQLLFNAQIVQSLLKPGDHLLGCASVSCPDCIKGHGYILDILWGKGGTFAEIENDDGGKLILPTQALTETTREQYFRRLRSIPTKPPVPIAGR
jgi:hypothetical protein